MGVDRKGLGGWRRLRSSLARAEGALMAAGLGFPPLRKLLESGWIRYNKWDRREKGALRVGHLAPDLELTRLDGRTLRLSELWRERPAVLIFGSCT